jgi:hypothetical protein
MDERHPTANRGPAERRGDRAFTELRGSLRQARAHTLRRWLLIGSTRALAASALALGLAAALVIAWPRSWAAPIGAGLVALTVLAVLWREIIAPLRRAPSVAQYTRAIDERYRAQGERHEFLSALELGDADPRSGVSPELVSALIAERAGAAGRLDLAAPGRRTLGRRWVAVGGSALLILLGLGLAVPGRFTGALAELARPHRPSTSAITIQVLTGNLRVEQGADVTVEARITGGKALVPAMHVRRGAGVWRTLGADTSAAAAPHVVRFVLPGVDSETRYRVAAGGASSPEYLIRVLEPLRVASFQVEYRYPDYSRLGTETVQAADGAVAALKGTQARLRFVTSQPVRRGTMEIAGEAPVPITLSEPTHGEVRIPIRRATSYTLTLERERRNDDPASASTRIGPYAITPTPDLDPLVVVLKPGQDSDVPADMRVPVTVHAADDYGLSSVTLHYSSEGGTPGKMRIGKTTGYPREVTETATWDVSSLKLLPGDLVSYYVEVYDNDTISGPKKARSRAYTLRVPTLAELYAEVGAEHQSATESLEAVREEGMELKEELERIAREMTKFPQADWEDRQEVAQAFERQQAMRQEVEKLAKSLGESLSRLENQELVDDEVLAKVSEIQRLLNEIGDEDLKDAFKRLSEQLAQLDPNEVQKALKDLTLTHEDLLQNLERTLEMLRQVQLEEKLDQAVQKAEEVAKQQDEINEGLEEDKDRKPGAQDQSGKDDEQRPDGADNKDGKSGQESPQSPEGDESKSGEQDQAGQSPEDELSRLKNEDMAGLQSDQEQNQESADELSKMLEELAKELAEQNQQAGSEMQQLSEQSSSKGSMQSSMKSAMQQMQQGNPKGAQKSGQSASAEARSMLERLRMQQQQMMNAEAAETAEKLRAAARELLKVSENQESIVAGTSPEAQRLAEDQLRLLEATRHVNQVIEEIARTSIMVGTDFAGLLGQPIRSMENATSSYERSNLSGGRLHGFQALAQVNEVILELLETEQSMCQAGGGSCNSMKKSMQALGGLSEQQQQVNDGTRQLMQGGGTRLAEGGAQRLARLAAQQAAIQKGMEEVAQSLDGQRDVLGNLSDLSRQMDETAKEMARGNVDDRVLSQQHQIMSRLLDAQRSVRKRDLGRERLSRPGEEVPAPSDIPDLPAELLTRRERLEADILRGRSDSYPPEFRELVERYFRALIEARAETPRDDGSAPN